MVTPAELHQTAFDHYRSGRRDLAIDNLNEFLRLRPDVPEVHNDVGIMLAEEGRYPESVVYLQEALRLKPDYAFAHNNLGNVWRELGKLDEAAACYERALVLSPGYAEAHNNLGLTFQEMGRPEQSRAEYERALQLKPDYTDAYSNLGRVLQEFGELEAAAASFRQTLRHQPEHANALAALATLLPHETSDAEIALMRERAADARLTAQELSILHFGLAQVFDVRGNYAEAAAHLKQANAIESARWRQRGMEYDPADTARFVDRLRETFSPEFFQRMRGWGVNSERPVFIFGLPRSGTTLLEQILASHTQVFGGGELTFARSDFEALAGTAPTWVVQSAAAGAAEELLQRERAFAALDQLTPAVVQHLAHQHLHWLLGLNAAAARVTSKMPSNWLYVGLLAVLFPRARFIYARRDSRDAALSCWMTNFQKLNWTSEIDHIVSRVKDHQRLIAHWQAHLPMPILTIDYEQTVADLEGTARRLIDHLGLQWEDACLEFHKTRRPIRTASATQVRKPLYRSSVGRWRNYEPYLRELFEKLEA
jgi:tetratricopeptide (TPR) repeat protein